MQRVDQHEIAARPFAHALDGRSRGMTSRASALYFSSSFTSPLALPKSIWPA